MLQGARMAFHDWNLWDLTSTPFVGIDNFLAVFRDPAFPTVAWNSVLWVVGSLVPQLVIGFLIALALRGDSASAGSTRRWCSSRGRCPAS